MLKKIFYLSLTVLLVQDVMAAHRKKIKKTQEPAQVCANNEARCKDLNDSCQCYCAYKGAPRDKVADDKPIFIENDKAGIYCYCKQRDIDKDRADHPEHK